MSWKNKVGGILGLPLLALAGSFLMPLGSSCGRGGDHAMETLQQCDRAQQLLGENIKRSTFGWACGSTETQGGLEQSSWDIPVSGSKTSGRYQYAFHAVGGSSTFSAQLKVGDEIVQMVDCRVK